MTDSTLLYATWHAWIGKRVCVKGRENGTLRYFGEVKLRDGFWCGVELDKPMGENNGMANNVQYFTCKAKHGIFVPPDETTRLKNGSTKMPSVCDLSKLNSFECKNKPSATENLLNSKYCPFQNSSKFQISNFLPSSEVNLDKTFDINKSKNIQEVFCFKSLKDETIEKCCVVNENVFKKSRNMCGRLETEESLGIIPDLLVEDGSWDILDNLNMNTSEDVKQMVHDGINLDSVFIPMVNTLPNDNLPYSYSKHINSPLQSCVNDIKYTSTPKHCLNNIIDLNMTVKLENSHSYDFLLHNEGNMEPIIAGSSEPKFEMDFDPTEFKKNEILCSTSKITLPSLQIQSLVLDEISDMKNEATECIEYNNVKYPDVFKLNKGKNLLNVTSTISNECVDTSRFSNIYEEYMIDNTDILNVTYKIKSDSSMPSAASILRTASPHSVSGSNQLQTKEKCNSNLIKDLNSTFVVMYNDNTKDSSRGENTFVVDYNPINVPQKTIESSATVFKKQVLNTIFEKDHSANFSEIHVTECNSELDNKIDSNVNYNSKFYSGESISQPIGQSISSLKITKKKVEIASDLNSTFFISSNSKPKQNLASRDLNKRYSLPSVSKKNNTHIHKQRTEIKNTSSISSKINVRKSIVQSQSKVINKKTNFQVVNPFSKTTSISLKQFKNIQDPDDNYSKELLTDKGMKIEEKNQSEILSAKKNSELFPKSELKVKCSVSLPASVVVNMTEKCKRTSDSCKSMCNLTVKDQNASNLALEITEKDLLRIHTRCKTAENVQAKCSSNIYGNSNKISISELSTLKHEVNVEVDSHGFNSKSTAGEKLGKTNLKPRTSILPTGLSNGSHSKSSISKRSGISCMVKAPPESSLASVSRSVLPSKIQAGFGYKKENARESTGESSFPSEQMFENKKNNPTISKSKLLKPGMLSRLPVSEKSIKKPGFILSAVESHSQPDIENINGTDPQRISKRLPLRKLQDPRSYRVKS